MKKRNEVSRIRVLLVYQFLQFFQVVGSLHLRKVPPAVNCRFVADCHDAVEKLPPCDRLKRVSLFAVSDYFDGEVGTMGSVLGRERVDGQHILEWLYLEGVLLIFALSLLAIVSSHFIIPSPEAGLLAFRLVLLRRRVLRVAVGKRDKAVSSLISFPFDGSIVGLVGKGERFRYLLEGCFLQCDNGNAHLMKALDRLRYGYFCRPVLLPPPKSTSSLLRMLTLVVKGGFLFGGIKSCLVKGVKG